MFDQIRGHRGPAKLTRKLAITLPNATSNWDPLRVTGIHGVMGGRLVYELREDILSRGLSWNPTFHNFRSTLTF